MLLMEKERSFRFFREMESTGTNEYKSSDNGIGEYVSAREKQHGLFDPIQEKKVFDLKSLYSDPEPCCK